MKTKPPPIQIDTDTWIIMREYRQQPKAIVHRVTSTAGEARYLLMTWEPLVADRRMVAIHKDLFDADNAVPWPSPVDAGRPRPDSPPEIRAAWEARHRATQAGTDRRTGNRVPVANTEAGNAFG